MDVKLNVRLVILCESRFFWELSMHRIILRKKKNIKVLEISKALANIFEIIIRGMVCIQINIFAVSLFTREQKSNS